MFSSVYYTVFYSIFNSSLSHIFFQPSSSLQWFQHHSFSCLFWLILQSSLLPAIHPLFPPLLYCYFFPLLPSFLPTPWQPGLVRCRLREPRIHVVQGRRWGTWGLGPLAKTTSPAVAWCLPLPTDLSPRYFTLSPKIHLWIIPSFHSSFSLHSLSPNLMLSPLTWNGNQLNFSAVECLKLTVFIYMERTRGRCFSYLLFYT